MQPTGAYSHMPDPDFPGWHTWQINDGQRFNTHALGRMIIRPEGTRGARLRLVETQVQHSNLHGNIHGGVTLSLIDAAMFATIYTVLGADAAGSVTLDLHNQFVATGRVNKALDVVSEVMKETGRLVFLRGTVEQGEVLVASYIGTLRKPSSR